MFRELVIRTKNSNGKIEMILLEDNNIVEYRSEAPEGDCIGDIYIGKITDVVKSYEASFVDVGFDKPGFLTGEVLKSGALAIVQVIRQEHDKKGVSLTSKIKLSGSFCVITPESDGFGISRKISDSSSRERILALTQEIFEDISKQFAGMKMGIILRTSAEKLLDDGRSDLIKSEALSIASQWALIHKNLEKGGPVPRLLYSAGDLAHKILKDFTIDGLDSIIVDSGEYALSLKQCAADLGGNLEDCNKINILPPKLLNSDIFVVKSLASKLDKLLLRKVWLNSGAYILIEPTEALTVIDVNSGKFTKTSSLDQIASIVNTEAAIEIMRQLRLRDIGGIIICDFIDMSNISMKDSLLSLMRMLATSDSGKTTVVDITSLGLVEITRKRVRNAKTNY